MHDSQLKTPIIPQIILNHIEELIENDDLNSFPIDIFPSPFNELVKECN